LKDKRQKTKDKSKKKIFVYLAIFKKQST